MIVALSLPKEVFSSPDVAYVFCGILITCAQIIYFSLIFINTRSLFSFVLDGKKGDEITCRQYLIATSILVLLIELVSAVLFTSETNPIIPKTFYFISFGLFVAILAVTVFLVFLSHDLETKKEIAENEHKKE
jgi:hypothetical protein